MLCTAPSRVEFVYIIIFVIFFMLFLGVRKDLDPFNTTISRPFLAFFLNLTLKHGGANRTV